MQDLLRNMFIDKNGNLSAAKIVSMADEIKNVIKNNTKCLDVFKNMSISDRIRFILNPIKIQQCKKCKKLWIEFPGKYGNLYQNCRCRKHGVATPKKSDKIENFYKQAQIDIRNKIFDKQEDFNKLVNKLNECKNYGLKKLFSSNYDLACYVLQKTINLLPVNEDEPQFSERCYILKNELKEFPVCEYCGNKLTYYNFQRGYVACSYCSKKQSESIKKKSFEESVEYFKNNSDFEWLNKDEFNGKSNFKFKMKHVSCGTIFEKEMSDGFMFSKYRYLRCPYCKPTESNQQREIYDFLKDYFSDVQLSYFPDKGKKGSMELDVFIPSKMIGIEFNGEYWHRDDSTYHLRKTEYFKKKGIKVIHIFGYQWESQRNLIKEKLKAILGVYDEKVYARKCVVKEINVKEKNEFLNKYHIQGEDKSVIKLGLFHEDELVAVMTFGYPRFNDNFDWELIRYATSKHVIGGAGKLLAYFRKTFVGSIITYANRCWSQGNMYEKLGFKLIGTSKPSYFYSNKHKIVSRYQTQKSKLQKLLGDKYDPAKTESENMENSGFYKIYDCGNLIYVMESGF